MIIQNNLLAMQAQRMNKIITGKKQKVTEKLSSGYKINRAADDSASLSISEKMRTQIRALNQGTENVEEGISLTQIADGALNETNDLLQRMNELSVKAANGTLSPEDREYVQAEMNELVKEVDRIAYSTNYNEAVYPLLGGVKNLDFTAAPGTVNKLSHVEIHNGHTTTSNVDGNGALALYASTGAGGVAGAGGLGGGSVGTMIRVVDDTGKEVKVMLHRDQFSSGGKLKVDIAGDVVTFKYDDPALGIKFEVEQSYSIYNETDEATQTGYSFYDIKNKFTNLSGKNVTYDIATAFDDFGGRYTPDKPFYVNGVPHSNQMKESAAGGGNYEIVTPPTLLGGLSCEVVMRISGKGILDDADQFMMLGDTNSQSDRNQIWQDVYSNSQTSGGSAHLAECDETYGMWKNKGVASGGSYTTNVLHGIKFKVEPKASGSGHDQKEEIWIQAGGEDGNGLHIKLVNATAKNLDIDPLDVSTQGAASGCINKIKNALGMCSEFRSQFGAYTNRMESIVRNNENISENTQQAESLLRDADMAENMMELSNLNILSQASQTMLAQANQLPQNVLSLLK